VVVGRVIEVRDHPNGQLIWLADVDLGSGDPVQIVFGGMKRLEAGSLVPVAPPGARLDGVKMRRRSYRGQSSHGMLCSLAELGWDPRVTDRVAMLTSDGLKPGVCLDDRANDWQSIVLNPRSERTRSWTNKWLPFSGEWSPGKAGLRRRRVTQRVR
jgi:tRNA-binding EMAP/Myf-like protein